MLEQPLQQSEFQDCSVPAPAGIYRPDDIVAPYPHTETIKEIVHNETEKYLQAHKNTWREPTTRERFYQTILAIVAEEKALSLVISKIEEKNPDLALMDQNDPHVKEEILKFHIDNAVESCFSLQQKEIDEIRKIIWKIFSNQEIFTKLIQGNQQIIDLAAGRGELGLSLLFELHLKRLQALGQQFNLDPNAIKDLFSDKSFSPNHITFVEPFDYRDNTKHIISATPFQLKSALNFEKYKFSNSTIQDISFPDDAIIIGHRLCGSLLDVAIESFSNSKASMLTAIPCCFYKAINETPHHGLSNDSWNEICINSDIGFFDCNVNSEEFKTGSKNFIEALQKINDIRLDALNQQCGVSATCDYSCSLGIISALKSK